MSTTTTPAPVNGFVVIVINGITKEDFELDQDTFKLILANAAQSYCAEFDCMADVTEMKYVSQHNNRFQWINISSQFHFSLQMILIAALKK